MSFNKNINTLTDSEIIATLDQIKVLEETSLYPKNHYNKTLVKLGHALLNTDPDGKRALDPFIGCYEKNKASFFDIEKQYDEKIATCKTKKTYHKNAISFVHYGVPAAALFCTATSIVFFRNFISNPENYPFAAVLTTLGSFAASLWAADKVFSNSTNQTRKEFMAAQQDLLEFEQNLEEKNPEFASVIDAYNALADKNHHLINNEPESISMAHSMVVELAKRRSYLKI